MEKAENRRIRYTKLFLKDALIELLKTKSISEIKIKELCELADVNRSTFYIHYTDQFDLLKQIEDEIMTDIKSMLDNYYFQTNQPAFIQMLTKILEYANNNIDICKVLLNELGDISFQKKIFQLAENTLVTEINMQKAISADILENIYQFVVNGCIGLIQNWIKKDRRIPPKELAELMARLINQGKSAFI